MAMYVFFGVAPLLTPPPNPRPTQCSGMGLNVSVNKGNGWWVVVGGGRLTFSHRAIPPRRVSLKWRRSIELRGHRAKGGDADGDVERYASEAPSSAQPLLRVCLLLSVGKVFFDFDLLTYLLFNFSAYLKGYGWSHLLCLHNLALEDEKIFWLVS